VAKGPDRAPAGTPGPSVTARRLVSQMLCGPTSSSAVDVVGRLLAVQAQDVRAASSPTDRAEAMALWSH
jgi:hypothetical protein